MRPLLALLLATIVPATPSATATAILKPPASTMDHSLLTAVLAAHVSDGKVDYAALRSDERLDRYLAVLAATDPAGLTGKAEQLAFWLNAYNAYTLRLVLDRNPAKSITQIGRGGLVLGSILRTTAWDIRFARIGGRDYTLNEIEHEVIRRQFGDARAHFALVCASGSCPALRTEAYSAASLDAQLDDQGKLFLRDSTRNRFDVTTRTAHLSSIFKWFKGDFGRTDREALLAAAKYAPDEVRRAIEAEPDKWRVKYLAYDWSLNSR